MSVRGVRGAIVVEHNSAVAILAATEQLLLHMTQQNHIDPKDIASCWLTTTPDLTAVFPAKAARDLGWLEVPLLCAHEMAVPGALAMCLRVMIHWNTDKTQDQILHSYLNGAEVLRPDCK